MGQSKPRKTKHVHSFQEDFLLVERSIFGCFGAWTQPLELNARASAIPAHIRLNNRFSASHSCPVS